VFDAQVSYLVPSNLSMDGCTLT